MFTITNNNGKVIAFAGRAMAKSDKAKYMNSPETPIYNKSRVLYGLYDTKHSMSNDNLAIIVEGYFDFLQLYNKDIENVVQQKCARTLD